MLLNKDELTKSLEDTRRWCVPLVDITKPKSCFRTSLLRKKIAESQGSDFDPMGFWPTSEEVSNSLSIKKDALNNILEKKTPHNSGRLLLCIPDWSNFNGLSRDVSNDYLDDHDVPPWDTWVGQLECSEHDLLLLAWVPDEFLHLVEVGIQVECVGMLHWANSKYWGEYTTPNTEFLDNVPEWIFEHESAKT